MPCLNSTDPPARDLFERMWGWEYAIQLELALAAKSKTCPGVRPSPTTPHSRSHAFSDTAPTSASLTSAENSKGMSSSSL